MRGGAAHARGRVRGLLRDAETFAVRRWMAFIMRIYLYRVGWIMVDGVYLRCILSHVNQMTLDAPKTSLTLLVNSILEQSMKRETSLLVESTASTGDTTGLAAGEGDGIMCSSLSRRRFCGGFQDPSPLLMKEGYPNFLHRTTITGFGDCSGATQSSLVLWDWA